MSHIGIPGPIGVSGKGDDKYSPYDLGWNTASSNFHPITGLTLENLDSRGWIEGYLAYVRAYLETEKIELRRALERYQRNNMPVE